MLVICLEVAGFSNVISLYIFTFSFQRLKTKPKINQELLCFPVTAVKILQRDTGNSLVPKEIKQLRFLVNLY